MTVARHLPLELTCLDRAIALHRMLQESGIEATVRIGVARHTSTVDVERPLVAHAWVEHCGRVLLDDDVSGFSAFDPSTPPQQNESERT